MWEDEVGDRLKEIVKIENKMSIDDRKIGNKNTVSFLTKCHFIQGLCILLWSVMFSYLIEQVQMKLNYK